jgi:hypothetical protein
MPYINCTDIEAVRFWEAGLFPPLKRRRDMSAFMPSNT